MEIHVIVAFPVSRGLKISRTTALDLDTAASLLLNVLHVRATMSNNLSSEVETSNLFEIDRYLCLGPFALLNISE